MKLAFWNCTLGATSTPYKKAVFAQWCIDMVPDMLYLIEAGSAQNFVASTGELEQLSGMNVAGYVGTLDRNLDATPKCIVLLATDAAVRARAIRAPEGDRNQRRMVLKVVADVAAGNVYVLGHHADASAAGGRAALGAIFADEDGRHPMIFGGDFNCGIAWAVDNAPAAWSVIQPIAHDGDDLNFTQWNWRGDRPIGADEVHLPGAGAVPVSAVGHLNPNPAGCIDYVVSVHVPGITAVPNCFAVHWRDILMHFDHCPVVYDVP